MESDEFKGPDEELAALQREIASITQPVFDQPSESDDFPQSPPVNALLSPAILSDDVLPFIDQTTPSEALPKVESPSAEHSVDRSKSEIDFSAAFPVSAGEAGTAIFDASSLKSLGFITPKPDTAPKVKANFYAQVTTPDISFEGLIHALSEREVFVKSRESLQRGEQVKLSFTLPSSQEHISCIALVREVRPPSETTQNHLIQGVSLRFLNLRPAQEALIIAEVRRQTQS